MAENLGRGHARKPKNMEYGVCLSTDLLDCYRVTHSTDHEGGLPLMKDVSLWNEARYPSISKSCAAGRANSHSNRMSNTDLFCERLTLRSNLPKSRQRSDGSEEQREMGAIGTGAQRYTLQPNHSGYHQERGSARLKVGCTLQAGNNPKQKATTGANASKYSSMSVAHYNTVGVTDDEFSLQHWMNLGGKQVNVSLSNHQRQRVTTDARELRSSKPSEASRGLPPSNHVCEIFQRDRMKKRKLPMLRQCSKLSPQNVKFFCTCHHKYSHGQCSSSLSTKQPRLVEQGYASITNRAEGHNKHEWMGHSFFYQFPFVTECAANSESLKSRKHLIEFLRARLLSLQEVKVPFSLDELDVSIELPRGGKRKARRSLTGKRRRKTAPNSSSLSGSSRRKHGASRAVNVKVQCSSTPECMLEVHNRKETRAMFVPTESLACSSNNQTLNVKGSVKDLGNFIRKLDPNRQVIKDASRTSNGNIEEELLSNSTCSRFKARSLSQKYRPKVLDDLIGQSLVARALSNAISKDKVAPVYLFQGSHGTGKTSAARIFSMAINCFGTGERKPCGLCSGCIDMISGKASCVWEVDAASYNGIAFMHEFIESIDFSGPGTPRYKIVIIEECHMFSSETWSALIKLFEEPPANAVFILITTEPGNLPLSVVSRCQRFHFLRIKHADVVNRLVHIAKLENLFAEPGALSLIASKSDGSLRNAETVLDQVSLLEQRITPATIHNLVGSVSDDKLMSLLDLALCSDMVSTVQKTREIMDLGVDPLDLITQIATLITDILAGSYVPVKGNEKEGYRSMHALSDLEMERLGTALRILSEAERQVRTASLYRSTWLIAALLQLGPILQPDSEATVLSKSLSKTDLARVSVLGKKRHGLEDAVTDESTKLERESLVNFTNHSDLPEDPSLPALEGKSLAEKNEIHIHLKNPSNLARLWLNLLKCCTPLSLRQLLQNHGKLLAVSFTKVNIVAHLVFDEPADKATAEMHRSCILNSLKKLLGPSVEAQFNLASDLYRAGIISYSQAAATDALWTQITPRHCAGDYELQNDKGRFKLGAPRIQLEVLVHNTPDILSQRPCSSEFIGRPLVNNSNCLPLANAAAPSRCRAETVSTEEHNSKSAIHSAEGCRLMQPSTVLGGSSCLKDIPFKHQPRRHPWRLIGGFHARKFVCDCVVAGLMNANSTEADSLEVENL